MFSIKDILIGIVGKSTWCQTSFRAISTFMKIWNSINRCCICIHVLDWYTTCIERKCKWPSGNIDDICIGASSSSWRALLELWNASFCLEFQLFSVYISGVRQLSPVIMYTLTHSGKWKTNRTTCTSALKSLALFACMSFHRNVFHQGFCRASWTARKKNRHKNVFTSSIRIAERCAVFNRN